MFFDKSSLTFNKRPLGCAASCFVRTTPPRSSEGNHVLRHLALVSSVAVLASCSTGDQLSLTRDAVSTAEHSAPSAWAAAEAPAAPPRGDWIADFNDLTLTALVDEALSSNFSLLQTAARVEQARQLARSAGAPQLPSLDANISGRRSEAGAKCGEIGRAHV